MREFRYALRRLRASPMFTTAATLTMTIAIGATASVFAIVDGVVLKAFPYRDADRVMVIWESNLAANLPEFAVSPDHFLNWRAQNTPFATLAASTATLEATGERQFTVTGGREPERIRGLIVTPNYFVTLGLTPVLGRVLAPDSAGPAEALISYGYWQRRFGGARSALGQTLGLDNQPYTIVGVMPAGVPGDIDVWTRLSFPGGQQIARGHFLVAYGRLKPGVTVQAARTDMETIAARLVAADPRFNKGWSVVIHPIVDDLVGDVRPALVMLLSAAACVLLIGAANLANLFLVRCLGREREMAVRTAMGATRTRLAGELLTEAGTLSIAAGALGIVVAYLGVRILRALAPPAFPRLNEVGIDARVVAFCAFISVATVLIFGALPAWHTSRGNLAEVLKEGGRGTGSAQTHWLQDGLVVVQVAVALVLLTGAGLLVESFVHLRQLDPGFRPEGVVAAAIALSPDRYATPERQRAFVAGIVDELSAQPGVDAASASSLLPVGDPPITGLRILGNAPPDSAHPPIAGVGFVSAGYFQTLGIRVLRGRGILPTDDIRGAKVVVVDDHLERKFFGGSDPVGQRLMFGPGDTLTVVGVVSLVKEDPVAVPDIGHVYIPIAQTPFPLLTARIAVHTSGDLASAMRRIRQVVTSYDQSVPVSDVQTMTDRLGGSIGTSRFSSFLASLFAVVALFLGMVGIYSVLAYIVGQRQREIAVRMALGAKRSHVMGNVLGRALVLSGIGIAIGSLAAWMLTRALAGLFVGVSPHDPSVFLSAAGVFAVVALVAATVPALRTTRVNPVAALASN